MKPEKTLKRKILTFLNNFANRYIYFKMCWGRTNGHIGIPMEVLEKIALFSIWLKVFDVGRYWMLGLIIVAFSIFMFTFGHIDLEKWRLFERETNLTNKYNPQIQEILRRLRKNGSK